jgi:predicted nucleic acid-binding protein
LPKWVSVVPVKDHYRTVFINRTIDLGESSTIALASEIEKPLVILDDGKARKYAKSVGLKMTGTLGIIRKCYELGIIDNIMKIIDALREVNFCIPNNIENILLKNK